MHLKRKCGAFGHRSFHFVPFLVLALSLSVFAARRKFERFRSTFLREKKGFNFSENGDGVPSRQIQARLLGRSIGWKNQHHHPLHVRQIRHHLSGPILLQISLIHSQFQFSFCYGLFNAGEIKLEHINFLSFDLLLFLSQINHLRYLYVILFRHFDQWSHVLWDISATCFKI